jgi:HAMP domain-containing protein
LPGGELFYVASPLVISEKSCLRCHSTPENAPKSQIATYGRDNGFGWQLNEIIGAKIVSVPASTVFNEARRLQFLVIGSLSVFFLLAMIMINIFLKFAVTNPLKRMAQLSKKVSTGDMEGEFEHPVNDEIGILAASLNRMKVSLQMAMNMLNTEIQE